MQLKSLTNAKHKPRCFIMQFEPWLSLIRTLHDDQWALTHIDQYVALWPLSADSHWPGRCIRTIEPWHTLTRTLHYDDWALTHIDQDVGTAQQGLGCHRVASHCSKVQWCRAVLVPCIDVSCSAQQADNLSGVLKEKFKIQISKDYVQRQYKSYWY